MHKILSSTILLALASVSLTAVSDQERVQMCHKGQEFNFVEPSVQAHLNHGDTKGSCENGPSEPGSGDMDGITAVVLMRCDATTVVSFTASFDFASIQPLNTECPDALLVLFENGFKLRSITSGSASEGDDLQMYTDYLLLGEDPEDEEPEEG